MPLVLCPLFLVRSPNFIEEGGGYAEKNHFGLSRSCIDDEYRLRKDEATNITRHFLSRRIEINI